MKKVLIGVTLLILFDQVVKLVILRYMIDQRFTIISSVFYFEPHHNIYNGWIYSMIGWAPPIVPLILLNIAIATFAFLVSQYLTYLHHVFQKSTQQVTWSMIFLIAGITCGLIDIVFWSGSLDFIRLFDWFIFDIKDVYLNIFWLMLVIPSLSMEIEIRRMRKSDKIIFIQKHSLKKWLQLKLNL